MSVRASVCGEQRRFLLQLRLLHPLHLLSQPAMEMIVSMVTQLCAPDGDLDGPIEVELHKQVDSVDE